MDNKLRSDLENVLASKGLLDLYNMCTDALRDPDVQDVVLIVRRRDNNTRAYFAGEQVVGIDLMCAVQLHVLEGLHRYGRPSAGTKLLIRIAYRAIRLASRYIRHVQDRMMFDKD